MGNCCFTKEVFDLKNIDCKLNEDIPWFSLEGYAGLCRCIETYDADTVTITVPFCERVFKTKCRLAGIDAAEIRTKNLEEKKWGFAGKEYLQNLILNKFIWVRLEKDDKFGRPLGTLYINEEDFKAQKNSVNTDLITKGYAYAYDGKKKKAFEEWKKTCYTV